MIKKSLISFILFSFSFFLFPATESINNQEEYPDPVAVNQEIENSTDFTEAAEEKAEMELPETNICEDDENSTEAAETQESETQKLDFPEEETEEQNLQNKEILENPAEPAGLQDEENSEIAAESEENIETENSDDHNELTPVITKKELTIPGSDRPEVERFRKMYLEEKGEKLLTSALENAITYRLYVRHSLSEKEMPPELEYLPVVESNYKTSAKSKSGAIGLWQFMENSVKPFLILNDYVDERYDPWKSTEAALKKLSDNYNYFKDWPLAIAAYNCGMGALSKALAKSPVKDFWYLAEHKLIPTQTALYVPKLLAIADLAINSEYYGINLPSHNEEYEALYNEKNGVFDYITVKKAYSLNQLANEMRMDESLMKQLNPSYIRGFTHPSNESKIRLPLGMEKTASAAIAKIKPIDFPVKYKVVSGDSLWSISRKYGTTVSAICELNGINENDILRIGKILYIPSK